MAKTRRKSPLPAAADPRPRKTPAWVKPVLSAIASGHTDKHACLLAGICPNTLRAWSEKNRENLTLLTRARADRAAAGSKIIQDICLRMARKGSLQHLRMYWRLVDPDGYLADCELARRAEPERGIVETREGGPSIADLITITENGGYRAAAQRAAAAAAPPTPAGEAG